jgi:hypothetical protein
MKPDPRRIRRPDAPALARQLAAGRVVMAAAALAAPVPAARILGTDTATAGRVTWLTRMMAVRDGAIGAGGLAATRGSGSAAPWLLAGAVSDAVDAAVLAVALRQGRIKGVVPTAVVPMAAGIALASAVTALRLRRR